MGLSWSEAYRKAIRELMNDRTDDVAMGSASDFADYKYRVGVIEGLALAEREFLDIMEKIERSENG